MKEYLQRLDQLAEPSVDRMLDTKLAQLAQKPIRGYLLLTSGGIEQSNEYNARKIGAMMNLAALTMAASFGYAYQMGHEPVEHHPAPVVITHSDMPAGLPELPHQ